MSRLALFCAVLAVILWLVTWFTLPAFAAGNAPPPDWAIAPEPEWAVTVQEVTCMELGDCCGVHRECGPGAQPPAPVPLPWSGALLALGLAGLFWRMR